MNKYPRFVEFRDELPIGGTGKILKRALREEIKALGEPEKMKVNVLFFGATAASVGQREAELELDGEIRADQALKRILAAFPALTENHEPKSLFFAVNRSYASGAEVICPGDELAVFTAVSGG